jgi:hypothetical protein
MGITVQKQTMSFYFVMAFLAVILFFAYKIQFNMQQSISNFDQYEKFDCSLFHNSLQPVVSSEDLGDTSKFIPHYTRVKY